MGQNAALQFYYNALKDVIEYLMTANIGILAFTVTFSDKIIDSKLPSAAHVALKFAWAFLAVGAGVLLLAPLCFRFSFRR